METPVDLGRSGVTATFYPAGHILGASMVCLEGVEQGTTRRVMFSGDIAVADQLTVPGALPPRHLRPDVLVIEATYGDRLHAARALEENALVELVEQTILNRGQLLIPAFAVGRAQEILLILLQRLRRNKLAKFPIYVDGMVRSVCQVYTNFPAYQTEATRRLIEHFGNPFFGVADEIQPVVKPDQRDKILHGPPCAIVASSGMLSGGASAFYARTMIQRPKDAIAFTGYQDEESPGKQLLDLADGRTNQIRLAGVRETVGCTVRKYSLSAHADGPEIARLVEAINPRQVVLVHGEGQARARLADLINRTAVNQRRIYLPHSGDTLRFESRRQPQDAPRPATTPNAGPGAGRELDDAALAQLADYLRAARPKSTAFSALEMLNLWYGTGHWTEEHFTQIGELLPKHERFRRHSKRQSLWLVRSAEIAGEAASGDSPQAANQTPQASLLDPEDVLQKIKNAFRDQPEAGLFHTGYHRGLRQIRLAFHFPQTARERYGPLLEELLQGTGWVFHIRKEAHQESLAQLAQAVWPAGTEFVKRPSILLGREAVSVRLAQSLSEQVVATAQAAFVERTGWQLVVEQPGVASVAAAGNESTGLLFPAPTGTAVREINECYWLLDTAWVEAPAWARPSKQSLKQTGAGEHIELSFITPEAGQRHAKLLEQLAGALGRTLSIKAEPNMIALLSLAQELVPPSWGAHKFGIHKEERRVSFKAGNLATAQAEMAEVSAQLEEMTGYHLTLK